MSEIFLRHTLTKKYLWHFIYQLLLHMVFTYRNWFAMQGPVAIILISWNVIFIWETGYWTRAIKRFVLSSNSRNKSKNDADEAVSVVSLTSSSGGYNNERNSANLELLIDKTSSIYLYVKSSCQLSTTNYDKRDDFNFEITNFPNMCSNILASPAYDVYISQLIRYARANRQWKKFCKSRIIDR
jgi:hypothetical protein